MRTCGVRSSGTAFLLGLRIPRCTILATRLHLVAPPRGMAETMRHALAKQCTPKGNKANEENCYAAGFQLWPLTRRLPRCAIRVTMVCCATKYLHTYLNFCKNAGSDGLLHSHSCSPAVSWAAQRSRRAANGTHTRTFEARPCPNLPRNWRRSVPFLAAARCRGSWEPSPGRGASTTLDDWTLCGPLAWVALRMRIGG